MAELREKCVMELGLNKALDQHWKDCDKLLRQVDAKDSIFELERIRKVLISRFESRNVDPMEARYPGKRTRRDKKLLKADIDKLIEPVKDFESFENLKRLYYGAAAMDMYQRHNLEMRKRAARKHREAYLIKERLRSEIRELEIKVDRARREKWCAEDLHLWEPHRLPNTERKDLALHGGPRSLDLFDERCEESSGMARLVHALQVSPVAYEIVSLGRTYSDAISKDF
ncbi:Hypothetical Protein FCC1311_012012 [Hondaea fermentalgiana]|uniref:Uncharacterized protein n=1 Tax=Hondaea fermentalgiana TaxID=2315210 RepID=A0A2R5GBA5_9STRA|nr:Hypothetical Protein FCC1311_012012 [Hondaea fermentalgiana]|eukprot:GBG24984.1 Hypothetical Protein FCC1311_012012 [Hondaea fermentalgiana]